MEFLLSDDERAIAELLPGFLREALKPEIVRGAIGSEGAAPSLRDLWTRFASLGVLGTMLPEDLEGLGMGLRSAAAVLEHSSAPVNPLPIFPTICHAVLPLSAAAARRAEPAKPHLSEICRRVVGGEAFASGITISEGEGLKLRSEKGALFVTGELLPFAGGREVDLIVLVIERKKGTDIGLLEVRTKDGPSPAVEIEPLDSLDLLHRYSSLCLDDAPVRILASLERDAARGIELRQWVLAAAELAGLGAEAVKLSVEFVKGREQFGRPVGSFQAIQHKLANMHLAVEQARALARFAAWCADAGDPQFEEAAVAAKIVASEAIPKVVEDAIQAHGGMGFTFESDLHLYLRRAQTRAMLFGDPGELAGELAERVLAEA